MSSFTRRQAQALLDWGRRDPKVSAAYSDPTHPAHAEVQRYANRLLEIAHAPGRPNDAGEPVFDAETFMARYAAGDAAARQRLDGVATAQTAPAPLDRPLPDDDGLGELRGLSQAEAAERIKSLIAHPEWGPLLTKEKDPIALAGWQLLNEIAAGVATAPPAAPAPAASPTLMGAATAAQADAMTKLNTLEAAILADPKHPARDPAHPNHQAATAERDAAYAAALSEGSQTQ